MSRVLIELAGWPVTLSKLWTVWCDFPSCGDWVGNELTGKDARELAKATGWTRKYGEDDLVYDHCPRHKDGEVNW